MCWMCGGFKIEKELAGKQRVVTAIAWLSFGLPIALESVELINLPLNGKCSQVCVFRG